MAGYGSDLVRRRAGVRKAPGRRLPQAMSGAMWQSAPVSRKPSAGEPEGWIGPEDMEIVAVRVAAGNRQRACSEHILDGGSKSLVLK